MDEAELTRLQSEGKKWESSLEGIHYNLQWISSDTVDEESYKIITCRTLQKIPKEARDEILEKTMFITVVGWGYVRELYFPVAHGADQVKQVVVTLNFTNMEHEGASEERMMDLIAHECAHVILGHYTMDGSSNRFNEREADKMSKKWGFKGIYTEKILKEIEKPIPESLSKEKVK